MTTIYGLTILVLLTVALWTFYSAIWRLFYIGKEDKP
jgi:hypothetical protein